MNSRLDIRKTYKLCIGGKFVRSESGKVLQARSAGGAPLDNYSWASRKDLRDAVVAARIAFGAWEKTTPYLRGQILYRAAEMLQSRAGELAAEVARSTCISPTQASTEITAAIDRLVYYAGWTDKYAQVFGSVNPVASPHFNFTVPEPTGTVAVIAPDEPALMGLVSVLAPVILTGNTAILIASDRFPLPALTFAEVLATSDLPAGVANILAGNRKELASHLANHMDINAIVDGSGDAALGAQLSSGTAQNLKRYAARTLGQNDWFSSKGEDPYWILDTIEFKTAWHPMGV